MKVKNQSQTANDPILAITHFHTYDLLQEEIQQMPDDLQEIFDLVLDSNYGDTIETRRKMLRIKELISNFAKALEPFTESQIQKSCSNYQNQLN